MKKAFSSFTFSVIRVMAVVAFSTVTALALGVEGHTYIEYDEATNTVYAYSETILDGDLMYQYEADLTLTVYKSTGGTAAYGSNHDQWNGHAMVYLSFQGEPGVTYTAEGMHRARLSMWDYPQAPPFNPVYFDDWWFASFENQGIYNPFNYSFLSPGYYEHRRVSNIVALGRTHDSVEVGPKLTITGPSTAKDGDTVTFGVTVQGGQPTGYQWTYSVDNQSNTGNNPQVNFNSATSSTTTALAHWYARPNAECATSPPDPNSSHPYYNSRYKIKVRVTFQSGSEKTKEADFTVNSWWSPAGQVNPNVARVTGIPTRAPDKNGVWRVTGIGTLGRLTPTKEVFISATSQFYAKTVAHEQVHEDHWTVGNLLGHLHNPVEFYARIENFTGTSDQNLINQMGNELTIYTNQQGVLYEQLRPESERRAYLTSDLLNPRFAFQNCGSYP